MQINDYTRAYENYSMHLEACEVLYGDNEKRTADAAHLVQTAHQSKLDSMQHFDGNQGKHMSDLSAHAFIPANDDVRSLSSNGTRRSRKR